MEDLYRTVHTTADSKYHGDDPCTPVKNEWGASVGK